MRNSRLKARNQRKINTQVRRAAESARYLSLATKVPLPKSRQGLRSAQFRREHAQLNNCPQTGRFQRRFAPHLIGITGHDKDNFVEKSYEFVRGQQ